MTDPDTALADMGACILLAHDTDALLTFLESKPAGEVRLATAGLAVLVAQFLEIEQPCGAELRARITMSLAAVRLDNAEARHPV